MKEKAGDGEAFLHLLQDHFSPFHLLIFFYQVTRDNPCNRKLLYENIGKLRRKKRERESVIEFIEDPMFSCCLLLEVVLV